MSVAAEPLDDCDGRLALSVAATAGLTFAAAQLYRIFCEATGIAGTSGRALGAPGVVAGQSWVRFDAILDPKLARRFEQERVAVRRAARTQVFYCATNLAARTISGLAVSNATPRRQANIQQDGLLLILGSDAQIGRARPHAGGVLRRSEAHLRSRHTEHRRNHVERHILPGGNS
ncbi:MAG: cytochrome c oxidase assembly protein [Pseudomonadota bacterium]|nr:cytochrome c oxidase assembly protein [Pseudomonadota bacterium]